MIAWIDIAGGYFVWTHFSHLFQRYNVLECCSDQTNRLPIRRNVCKTKMITIETEQIKTIHLCFHQSHCLSPSLNGACVQLSILITSVPFGMLESHGVYIKTSRVTRKTTKSCPGSIPIEKTELRAGIELV